MCKCKKYCNAYVVMLHTILGMTHGEICDETGWPSSAVGNVLSRRCNVFGGKHQKPRRHKRRYAKDFDLDQIEHEYLGGATTYELGEKYGVYHTTISKWMRNRGIHIGKGNHQRSENHFHPNSRESNERKFIERLREHSHGRFEYVADYHIDGREFATIRCTVCGYEFSHYTRFYESAWMCPECDKREAEKRKAERDAHRKQYEIELEQELQRDKICAECGSVFHSSSKNALYCSGKCKRRVRDRHRRRTPGNHRHYYHVKYGERYLEYYDPSVTLEALYRRDKGVCKICGQPCDWTDKSWGYSGPHYPSIDHIISRAGGGTHTWDNVQLTHCICNSEKRDKGQMRLAI